MDADRIVEQYVGGQGIARRTRGLRDFNPGNIRPGQHFKGEVGAEGNYCIFDSDHNGIRAIAVDLLTKAHRGLVTIRSIITVYAPPSDNNDTAAYIKAVCADTSFGPDDWLRMSDPSVLGAMVRAIIQHENGCQPFDDAEIGSAVADALA